MKIAYESTILKDATIWNEQRSQFGRERLNYECSNWLVQQKVSLVKRTWAEGCNVWFSKSYVYSVRIVVSTAME